MLKPDLIPSQLVSARERRAVEIVTPRPPSQLRWLHIVWGVVSLLAAFVGLYVVRKLTRAEKARRVRLLLEQLGGLWIKAGQQMSLRVDMLSPEMCHELAQLQSRVVGFPGEMAVQIIEDQLGAPIDQVFDEFNRTPFAAASVGQVHRAKLREEQVWVAVKVQKPYSSELFFGDLRFIEVCASLLRALRISQHFQITEALGELRQIVREELDFNFEASATRKMRRNLKRQKVYVPKVFGRYCRQRVMVTEFLHAALMADFIRLKEADPARLQRWLNENNIDAKKVARRLHFTFYQQLFEDNYYHGDMHPGNLVLLRNSRIALIDFGTTNFTELEYLRKYKLFARALMMQDYSKAADLVFMLAGTMPVIDLDVVKRELVQEMRAWGTRTSIRELPYHEKSIGAIATIVMQILWKYGIVIDKMFLRIHRGSTVLDATLIHLFPGINYSKMGADYFRNADRRELVKVLQPNVFYAKTLYSMSTGWDIQERVNEYTLFQGGLIRRHAQVFQGATNRFADIYAAALELTAGLILLPGLFLLVMALAQRNVHFVQSLGGGMLLRLAERFPTLSRVTWLFITFAELYLFSTFRRAAKSMRKQDVRPHERVAAV